MNSKLDVESKKPEFGWHLGLKVWPIVSSVPNVDPTSTLAILKTEVF